MSYLVLDIETVRDTDLSPAAEVGPDGKDQMPPLHACRVACIGAMLLDDSMALVRAGVIDEHGTTEASQLEALGRFMATHRPTIVTWNGRGFDLPVLMLRSLRHGIAAPWYYQVRDMRYRFSDAGHLDLCDQLSDHGAGRMQSLDGAARAIGLPGKGDVDGAQVDAMFRAGEIDALRDYCLSDVVQTAFLFLRWRLLTGATGAATYSWAATALLSAVEADPRLARVAAGVDRARLLLTEARRG